MVIYTDKLADSVILNKYGDFYGRIIQTIKDKTKELRII